MKRTLTALLTLFALLVPISLSLPISADIGRDARPPLVVDNADLLSDSEEKELERILDEISERQGLDVVVYTVYSLEGIQATNYADFCYDKGGYGQGEDHDGLLLLHSPEKHIWYISTCGDGIRIFTEAGLDYIGDQITPYLADGDNFGAYVKFAELCDKFITKANTDRPYDVGNLPKDPLSIVWIPICLFLGLFIAVCITSKYENDLKTVRYAGRATSYLVGGSFQLTGSGERFLYRNIIRTPKPKETSTRSGSSGGSRTHTSSSGRSHGGRGGRY